MAVSHYLFASLSLSFLGLFSLLSDSLLFPSSLFRSFNPLFFPLFLLFQWLLLLLGKEESAPQAFLRAKVLLVLLRVNLTKSLSVWLFLYGTPGTRPFYFFLRCLMARLFHPLMLGCFLVRRVLLVLPRFQTLERFLTFRLGKDFERRFLSSLISFLGRSKVGPFGWIWNSLMRSS